MIYLSVFTEKATLEETERTLYALKKLAQNPECTASLVDGLANYMRIIVTVTDSSECPAIEKAISELLNQILQVIIGIQGLINGPYRRSHFG